MKILGITGGVGSGKSQVLDYLGGKDGIVICKADDIAKDLQSKGSDCLKEIVECFGEVVLTEEKELDRGILGKLVFEDELSLIKLNQIVHPRVRERIKGFISEENKLGSKVFVLEAAILLETNYKAICDEVWYIYTNAEIRMQRLSETRGYTSETFKKISSNQMTEELFRMHSDRVIDNTKDIAQLYENIDCELKRFLGEL